MLRNTFFTLLICCSVSLHLGAQGYCKPYFRDSLYAAFGDFALHTLVNDSLGGGKGGYKLFPETAYTTSLNIGKRYPITIDYAVQAGVSSPFYVWIDYNDNKVFDTSELVYTSSTLYSTSGSVLVPNDTTILGKKRLRVLTGQLLTAFGPCASFVSGEADDYMITITRGVPDTPGYCRTFTNRVGEQPIIDFVLDSIVNINSGINSKAYSYYPASVFTTTLYAGSPHYIHFARDIAAGPTIRYSLWIDLNNDTVFTDNERLLTSPNVRNTFDSSFTIPSGFKGNGLRRMRIRSGYAAGGACGRSSVGETEDYEVRVIGYGISSAVSNSNNTVPHVGLYPNPATNMLFLRTEGTQKLHCDLELTSMDGRQLRYYKELVPGQQPIDLSGIAAGLYLARVHINGTVQCMKFVKL